mgnify:FL=1
MKKQLIIGMGTGRCGTVSLYHLLNSQKGSFIRHESKPLLTWIFDKKAINYKLRKLLGRKEKYVGDVNSCYLPYVDYICKNHPSVRIIVLKRSKNEVIKSFLRQTSYFNWNHWVDHEGIKWKRAGKWDAMFPKYKLDSKEDAIAHYWDEYYLEVRRLIKKYPNNIKVFRTEDLNSRNSIKKILNFCNIPLEYQKIKTNIKENQSGSFFRFVKYWFLRSDKL